MTTGEALAANSECAANSRANIFRADGAAIVEYIADGIALRRRGGAGPHWPGKLGTGETKAQKSAEERLKMSQHSEEWQVHSL